MIANKLFANFSELTKNSVANFKELADINTKTAERLGEQQMAFLGTMADAASKQVELVSESKSLQDVMSAQSEMAVDMSSKSLELANGTADILNQGKEEVTAWVEKTVKGTTAAAAKGAKKAA